jgi:hypothetical protein
LQDVACIDDLPDEMLVDIFGLIADPETLLVSVPAVCTRWRRVCSTVQDVNLDLGFALTPPFMALKSQLDWSTEGSPRILGGFIDRFPNIVEVHLVGLDRKAFSGPSLMAMADSVSLTSKCTKLDFQLCRELCTRAGTEITILVARCQKLTAIDLTACSMTDKVVVEIAASCPDLTEVTLAYNPELSDESLFALAMHCSLLKTLQFNQGVWNKRGNFSEITEEGVLALCTLKHLTAIGLNRCTYLTGDCIVELAKSHPRLLEISLESDLLLGTGIDEPALVTLAEYCPDLKKITLDGWQFLQDDTLVAVAEHCRGLESVALEMCESLTDAGIIRMAELCPSLSTVICGCGGAGEASIIALANHCPELERLSFLESVDVTDASLEALAQHCANLKAFVCTACDDLTDAGVQMLAEHCPALEVVHFAECDRLTDASVTTIASCCPKLLRCNFSSCTKITDASIVALAHTLPGLQAVAMNDCAQVTDASIAAIAEKCPGFLAIEVRGCPRLTAASGEALRRLAKLHTAEGVPGWDVISFTRLIQFVATHEAFCPNIFRAPASAKPETIELARRVHERAPEFAETFLQKGLKPSHESAIVVIGYASMAIPEQMSTGRTALADALYGAFTGRGSHDQQRRF